MRFLFERLIDPSKLRTGDPGFDLEQAVRDQIQRLVWTSTREAAGDAANAVGFGLPAIVDLACGGGPQLQVYARELKRVIDRYEPRLRDCRVEIEQTGELRALNPNSLKVTGVLVVDEAPQTVDFAVTLEPE